MGIALDILRSWRHPRRIIAKRLSEGVREDRAVLFLMLGCLLMFVSQWPRLLVEAQSDPSIPFDARAGAALLGWVFIVPLALYAVAGLARVVAMGFGGQGTWFSARMALFWALLAASPMWLLNGALVRVPGSDIFKNITGVLALLGFITIWLSSMIESETGGETQ